MRILRAILLASLGLAPVSLDDSEKPLLVGGDLAQFELVKIDGDSMTIEGDEIRLSGKPNGYFATKRDYKNYVVSFEFLYEKPENLKSDADFRGNSGLLLHVQPPLKVWPKSVEVQLAAEDAGNIFAIDGKFNGKKDAEAQAKAIKPVGEWNRIEATARDGSIVCSINGVEVARGGGAEPASGRIAWQSEGAPIRFRKLRIRERP